MKVFEVLVERYPEDSKEIIEARQYVTSSSLLLVTKHFAQRCDELGNELKSVREVLTVSETIEEEE